MAPMYRLGFRKTDAERDEQDRQTSALLGLALTLALVVAGLFLVQHLHKVSAIEDCLLAGRSNCDVLVSPDHSSPDLAQDFPPPQ